MLWCTTVRGPWAVGSGLYAPVRRPWGLLEAPGPKRTPWGPRDSMGLKNGPWSKVSPTWPGPIEGVQDHQDPDLPKAAGEALGDELSPKGVFNPHLRGFEGRPK
ncbi:hypothetical protein O181_102997 [Austropuccinia psidii MF-1]|uniref:Uncharacterized protein n=1 Tax=Austropuccinia psidii MF-1 TaxID=1389203 RepID=A0A9Q3JK90_9BASI|nr:hypothetical protein [Austropuccinia psidii MF-1]